MAGVHIVVIEDEGTAEDVRRILERLGYLADVIAAGDLPALAGQGAARPDLVLLDIASCGEMEGVQIVQALHALAIPVVAFGPGPETRLAQLARHAAIAEVDGYVLRPGEEGELRAAVEIGLRRRRARQEQDDGETRLCRLVENVHDVLYRYRVLPEEAIEYISPAATAVLGYAPAEFYADPELVWRAVHPDDRERLRRYHATPAGEPTFLARWIRKDGATIWVEFSRLGEHDQEGRLVAMQGITRDVTARIEAANALAASERRFRLVAQCTSDAIYEWDPATGAARWFSENGDRLGFPLEGRPEDSARWVDAIHPDDRDRVLESMERRLQDGGLFCEEYRIRSGDGNYRYWLERGMAAPGERGQPTRWIGALSDVTERRLAEAALRESEARFRGMFDHAAVGIVLTDREGRCVESNPAFQQMLGYSREELAAAPFTEFTHPEDREGNWEIHRQVTRGEVDWHRLEKRYIHKNGGVVWTQLTLSSLEDTTGQGPCKICVVEDITERKRDQEALRKSQEELRALSAALQSLREDERTHAAHEVHENLGQQLAGMKMELALLRKALDCNAGRAHSGPARRIDTLAEMLDGALAAARRLAADLRPGILDDLGLAAALEWQAEAFQERTGIRCELETPGGELALDRERSTEVFRIYQELLAEIARQGAPTDIWAQLALTDGVLRLEVRGTGGDMPALPAGPEGMGMFGVCERAYHCGGQASIVRAGESGTVVTVTIPCVESRQKA